MSWIHETLRSIGDCVPVYGRNWVAFFLLGLINNLAYVVINSSADDLVVLFKKQNLIGLVLWCNIFFGFFARLGNTFFMLDWSYASRIWITTGLFLAGIVGVGLSVYVDFWFSLACIVLIGCGSSLGESVLLGYLKSYESELVGGWSSGTGMAGVAGSALYLLFSTLGFSLRNRFLYMLPSCAIFILAYVATILQVLPAPQFERFSRFRFFVFVSPPTRQPSINEPTEAPPAKEDGAEDSGLISGDGKEESGFQLYWRCWKLCWWRTVNLCLVYFFEYVILPGCAAKVNPGAALSKEWAVKHAYVVLSFCYQFGVLISRSSLPILRIKWVELLTALQLLNFILWELAAYYHFLPPWAQFPLMVFVGLLGGASYVNVFYLLLNDPTMTDRDREICVNITAAAVVIGISAAAAFTLLMDNTWLREAASTAPPITLSPNSTLDFLF